MSGFQAPKTWTFQADAIAASFDEHVREQLPWYELATRGTRLLGAHYLGHGSRAYDIGAGNGNMARAFADLIKDRSIDFTSIEASKEMAKTFKAPGRLVVADACEASYEGADLVISFLTLIFIPPAARGALLERIIASLRPGGALIGVERVLPDSAYPSLACARLTLWQKEQQGASPAEIYAKEMSLIGIQRPMDLRHLSSLGAVEWFRMANFVGFVVEKPEFL
jgi:tRNA (cmo5U34)-methyltransferase